MMCLAVSGGREGFSSRRLATEHTMDAWCSVWTLSLVLYAAMRGGTVGQPVTRKAGLSDACLANSAALCTVATCFRDSRLDFHIVLRVHVALALGSLQRFILPSVSEVT